MTVSFGDLRSHLNIITGRDFNVPLLFGFAHNVWKLDEPSLDYLASVLYRRMLPPDSSNPHLSFYSACGCFMLPEGNRECFPSPLDGEGWESWRVTFSFEDDCGWPEDTIAFVKATEKVTKFNPKTFQGYQHFIRNWPEGVTQDEIDLQLTYGAWAVVSECLESQCNDLVVVHKRDREAFCKDTDYLMDLIKRGPDSFRSGMADPEVDVDDWIAKPPGLHGDPHNIENDIAEFISRHGRTSRTYDAEVYMYIASGVTSAWMLAKLEARVNP